MHGGRGDRFHLVGWAAGSSDVCIIRRLRGWIWITGYCVTRTGAFSRRQLSHATIGTLVIKIIALQYVLQAGCGGREEQSSASFFLCFGLVSKGAELDSLNPRSPNFFIYIPFSTRWPKDWLLAPGFGYFGMRGWVRQSIGR